MASAGQAVPFRDALRVWTRIGLLSFGGPAGQIALMHRILVDEKKWVSERRFLHALNYCMLLPGPEAQQLATYVGWLLHRTWGGVVAGTLFVLPGALVVLALSAMYAGLRDIAVVEMAFFGIKAAILAVVLEAVVRVGRRVLKNATMLAVAAVAFVALFFGGTPFPIVIVVAGVVGFVGGRVSPDRFVLIAGSQGSAESGIAEDRDYGAHTRPSTARDFAALAVCLTLWLGPVALLFAALGAGDIFTQLALFFSKMAVVTFGGAYAVLAYVAQAAVDTYGWLLPGEMLDGLGLAETTPGPLILVLEFVGFLAAFRNPGAIDPMLAGTLGAILTVWVTFVPSITWVLVGAPYMEALRGKRALSAALSTITAAVVGVVLNLAVWLALHVLFGSVAETNIAGLRFLWPELATLDATALALSLGAAVALFRFHLGILPTIGAGAALGIALGLLR